MNPTTQKVIDRIIWNTDWVQPPTSEEIMYEVIEEQKIKETTWGARE